MPTAEKKPKEKGGLPKTKALINRMKQRNPKRKEELMGVKRWHPVTLRKIQDQFLIEVRDLATGNLMAEMILPNLEAVKRFLDGVYADASEKQEATDVHGDRVGEEAEGEEN